MNTAEFIENVRRQYAASMLINRNRMIISCDDEGNFGMIYAAPTELAVSAIARLDAMTGRHNHLVYSVINGDISAKLSEYKSQNKDDGNIECAKYDLYLLDFDTRLRPQIIDAIYAFGIA